MFLMSFTASPMMIPISRSPLAKIEVGSSTWRLRWADQGLHLQGHKGDQPATSVAKPGGLHEKDQHE